ncbi:hypothetical protein [Pseudomonas sp. MWU16-30322]|uniref:hypothetical protein n=1 Tax=Pseudomonas sp. MWU16-30322 TaxID=2878092 RepID=UPI001CF9E8F5|nr:hypothetical protein [Pseudomonas sp. MWU16-30322]
MNQQQQDLMIDLVSHRISTDRFLESLFKGGEIPEDYLRAELETALEMKDADSVECLLIFGAVFGFTQDCADVLCRLLVEDWHISHESIARELKVFKFPAAVDYLFRAALTCYPYIVSEHALGVKCIHALHEIGTDNAKEKLCLLAKVGNAEMSKLATRLLARG